MHLKKFNKNENNNFFGKCFKLASIFLHIFCWVWVKQNLILKQWLMFSVLILCWKTEQDVNVKNRGKKEEQEYCRQNMDTIYFDLLHIFCKNNWTTSYFMSKFSETMRLLTHHETCMWSTHASSMIKKVLHYTHIWKT